MCLIFINKTADDECEDLRRRGEKLDLRRILYKLASEATETQKGALDSKDTGMSRMPPDLRHLRKYNKGRHRAYFTGQNGECCYKIWFVKTFKKTGVNDEDDERFQRLLKRALADPADQQLSFEDDEDEAGQTS